MIVHNPAASRFHLEFPPGNIFAEELADVLEKRDSYRLQTHPVFRYLHPQTADSLVRFCREPGAWLRFLYDAGVKDPIVGPDGGFYRSAAYQCFDLLPSPRSTRRLVESVYAATYCAREMADGRYGASELVELPYRFNSQYDEEASTQTATRIEAVPTSAAAKITVAPGIAAVLQRTRDSSQFVSLGTLLDRLGEIDEQNLPTESEFIEEWRKIGDVYADAWSRVFVRPSRFDKHTTTYSILAYLAVRLMGFLIFPEAPVHLDLPVIEDAAAVASIERFGPRLLSGFRATLKAPIIQKQLQNAARIRCSKVTLNVSS